MSKTAVVTARLTEEQAQALDHLAATMDRPRAWIVAKAIDRYVREETELRAFVQVGIDDLDAGRAISHDQLVERIAARRTRQAA